VISVVVPACNAERFLRETLKSISQQIFTNWEAIIVDDGSTDDTCEIAREFAVQDPRFRLIQQNNAGPSAARNCGAREASPASSEIIFLDSDDVWEPYTLQVLHDQLSSEPKMVASYGIASSINSEGEFIDNGAIEDHQRTRLTVESGGIAPVPIDKPTTFFCEIVREFIITSGTVLIRREAFASSGGWSEDLHLWEDWDLWLRLTKLGDFALVDQTVLRKRTHSANLSGAEAGLDEGERHVRKRLLNSLVDTPETLELARRGAHYYHRHQLFGEIYWALTFLKKAQITAASSHIRRAACLWRQGPVR
jgi:glycosyltransferase involved in cell wall biosynthesis